MPVFVCLKTFPEYALISIESAIGQEQFYLMKGNSLGACDQLPASSLLLLLLLGTGQSILSRPRHMIYRKGGNELRNRYMLCLLLCLLMLYVAIPRLYPAAGGLEGLFGVSWLLLAIVVLGGNLSALLYAPRSNKTRRTNSGARQGRQLSRGK